MIAHPSVADNIRTVNDTCQELDSIALLAAKDGRALDQVEQDIWDVLMRLGHQLIGTVLAQLGHGDVGPSIQRDGQKPLMRSDQPQNRRYRSVFGVFQFSRFTYAEHAKREAERVPFDEQIGLPKNDYSLLLEKWVGAAACEDSFEQAVSMLQQMLGNRIPVDSAERICRRQAERVEEFFEQLPTPPAEDEGEVLVATIDRKGVPLRRAHSDVGPVFGPSDRTGPKPGTKKMAAVGSVYSIKRHMRDPDTILAALFRERKTTEDTSSSSTRPRPANRRIRALLPIDVDDGTDSILIDSVAAICAWMDEEVESRQEAVEEVLMLCDGEACLWETASRFRSSSIQVTEILDLLHAVPRIWTCGVHLHGNKPLEAFVYPRIRELLEGKGRSIIQGFRRMATLQRLVGEAREAVDEACNYLERQLSRMRYDEYLSRGLPIATGVIEGACHYLIKDRLERSGMRWTIAGAQSILDLRSIKSSELASDYHAYYRAKKLEERYGEERVNYAHELGLAA